MSDSVILRAEDLCKSYFMGGRELRVLDGVDLQVRTGEILSVVGKSGTGKSTLLNLLGLLDRPQAGRLFFEGKDLYRRSHWRQARFRNREMGFVFQFYHLLPELDVLENTLLPALIRYTYFGWNGRKKLLRERARELLDRVGMGARAAHRPSQLSGGERQRVAIARALVNDPTLVFCDEPTGNLDVKTSEGIIDLIVELNRSMKKTFVIVTHEKDLASLGDRIVRIEDGKLAWERAGEPGSGAPAGSVQEGEER
jgi:lipoprotein-releasing system ATP-binding protein